MGDMAAPPPRPTRRDVIMGAAAAVAVSAGESPAGPLRGETPLATDRAPARGVVFEDRSRSGVHRQGDRGIAGVMVSNGRDVVLTGGDGSWCLPVSSGDSVFVVEPSGWSCAAAPGRRSPFHYLHQPDGTPRHIGLRHAGVAPTGPLPESIDFGLVRVEEPSRFQVVLVADTQPGDARELGFVRDAILSQVPTIGAAFAIHHGDVMGDDLSLLPRYLRMLGATGIPWHHCPGNHDMNLETPDGRHAFETWKQLVGPTHYAFQHAQATFILLNNVDYFGWDNIPEGRRGYRGRLGARQLDFVRNVLAHVPEDHLIVVSMHIPLVNFEDPSSEADTTIDRRALLELLSTRPHAVSFSGHSHTTEHHYLGAQEGFRAHRAHHHHVLTAGCGSWWSGPPDHRGIPLSVSRDGSPKGFHVLSIDGNRYSTRLVPVDTGADAGRGMRVLVCYDGSAEAEEGPRPLGCQIAPHQLPHARLVVDIFDGGPRTDVRIEIEGPQHKALPLQKSVAPDPFVIDFLAANPLTCKPWFEAAPCSHLWSAPLPPDLVPGIHRVTVRARDQYGADLLAHLLIEVAA